MQALTPDQSKAVTAFLWEAVDKGIWLALCWGGVKLHRSLKSIRPGIVADVTAAVNLHADKRMDVHEQKDDERFEELTRQVQDATSHMSPRRHATGD